MPSITRKNFTATFHHDTYQALKQRLKSASVGGKSVFISGSGTGIGAATALSFARAGAAAIVLSGRTLSTLQATQRRISSACPGVVVEACVLDIAEGPGKVAEVFAKVIERLPQRKLDVLVNNAGYIASLPTTGGETGDSWTFERYWDHFEVNVKGALALTAAFLEHVSQPSEKVTIINITSGAAVIDFVPGLSGYAASKLAAFKMFSYLAYEQRSGVRVFHLHPGVVATAMAAEGKSICDDTAELAADFAVWLNAPDADFLQNRFLYANWDVEELVARKQEIVDGNLLTVGIRGWDSTAM